MLLTRPPLVISARSFAINSARLACIRHAASVRPEPGSNSPFIMVCPQLGCVTLSFRSQTGSLCETSCSKLLGRWLVRSVFKEHSRSRLKGDILHPITQGVCCQYAISFHSHLRSTFSPLSERQDISYHASDKTSTGKLNFYIPGGCSILKTQFNRTWRDINAFGKQIK